MINLPEVQYRPINESRIDDMLRQNNLDWDVETQPLFLAQGQQTPFFGVVCQDNQEVFQTVSKQYEPIQNRDLVELGLQIADLTNSEIEVSRSLKGGAVTYLVIKGRRFEMEAAKVGDVVAEQIMLVNSHNGSKSFGVGFGHVVLSCTNGMTRFDRKGFVAIRHTASAKDKLKSTIKGLRRITQESGKMIEAYKRLAEVNVGPKEMKKTIQLVLDVDPEAPAAELSTRKQNQVKSLWASLTSEMSYKGQTAWGLMNGVTHYTTQIAAADKKGSKLVSKMFGATAKKEMSVWNMLNSI